MHIVKQIRRLIVIIHLRAAIVGYLSLRGVNGGLPACLFRMTGNPAFRAGRPTDNPNG
jgi:hypothetical protein